MLSLRSTIFTTPKKFKVVLGILIGGSLGILLIGVAITKLTVYDLVPVDARLKRCAMTAVIQQQDNTIERLALLLGKTRITKTDNNSYVEMESYTIFRLPMGVLRGQPDVTEGVFCDFFQK